MRRPTVVLLDAGGVLLLPVADSIALQLTNWGATPSGHDDAQVHYAAVAAFDYSGDMHEYRRRYAEMVGVSKDLSDRAACSAAFRGPWRRVVPGAVEALRRLAANFTLAVVSDSDGTVADQLREAGVAQIGPGMGVEIEAICDSAHLGAVKPNPEIFEAALKAVDTAARNAVMIGDSIRCDVDGALNLGIRAIHISPYVECAAGHADVVDIAAAAELLVGAPHG